MTATGQAHLLLTLVSKLVPLACFVAQDAPEVLVVFTLGFLSKAGPVALGKSLPQEGPGPSGCPGAVQQVQTLSVHIEVQLSAGPPLCKLALLRDSLYAMKCAPYKWALR